MIGDPSRTTKHNSRRGIRISQMDQKSYGLWTIFDYQGNGGVHQKQTCHVYPSLNTCDTHSSTIAEYNDSYDIIQI